MQDRFEGWVRVLCGGSLALAAYLAYAALIAATPKDTGRAALTAALLAAAAAGFAFWPERLAYLYRHGAVVPRWSKSTSVTRVDDQTVGQARDRYADYRPALDHLRSAFFSVVLYGALTVRLPRAADAALVWGIPVAAVAILYFATRKAPSDRGQQG